MSVPVQNIYYLLCYAWDRLEVRDQIDVDTVAGNRTENLLAHVLSEGVGNLIRRGLDRGYVPYEEEGRRLRGKLLVSETVKRTLLPRGRVACRHDELSLDVPHNRVLRAAMRELLGLSSLDPDLRAVLHNHCMRLRDVSDVDLSPSAFRPVQLHRNVAYYSFMMNVCRLVATSFLPHPETGRGRFHPFTANPQEMGAVFESFVRRFLSREQSEFEVSSPKIPWNVECANESDTKWLPEMRTDVTLTSLSQTVIIETKYYAQPFQQHHGKTKKLISSHLYQLHTYLSQYEQTLGRNPTGVLLYAGAGDTYRLNFRIGRHRIMIRTLDLEQPWRAIHRDLLSIGSECEGAA